MRRLVAIAAFTVACVPAPECERRIHAAHRDALQDAEACAYDPDGLDEPECENLDRRPLYTYVAVYCASATLDCVRDDDVATTACFGDPDSVNTSPAIP